MPREKHEHNYNGRRVQRYTVKNNRQENVNMKKVYGVCACRKEILLSEGPDR